ncbi:TorD/DmsD family molecular chaperone [Clostridium saccharoperbutylacetonicum]|uniref:TorD/DmsD family molecular chaperone n=1 Tax=Clostridium saccharoperbutylacetonicum TaxID=36745 RepID=UPI00034A73B4|nr:molecular chaperone TorD family protein [Clostridium saccharoperbutylacetonicum]
MNNFKNYEHNKKLSKGALEIINELNESDNFDYKKAILEEHQRLFVGPNELLAPLWKSVYKTKDKLLFGDIELEVRSYYNSVGLDVKPSEAADYLPLQLSFMSQLCSIGQEYNLEGLNADELEKLSENLSMQKEFLNKHLLSWVPLWVEVVNKNAGGQFWKGFAELTEGWLENDLIEIERIYINYRNF